LKLDAFPLPALGAGEVLVRVTCCTLCGSDLHTYQGHRPTPSPTVLGHEILGVVAAFGPDGPLHDLEGRILGIGDRVTWSVAASCGDCFYCGHDLPQKCERLFKYGHEKVRPDHAFSGGLAEYCHLAPGTAVVRVPEDLPDAVACPANCATATVAAALRMGGGCRDEIVLVQGAGMLGLTACAMAQTDGARAVIVCDVDGDRLAVAPRFGATHCVRAEDDALADAVAETTAGHGVDLAIELSGATSAMESGLDLLRTGGRYVLVGAVFPGPPVALHPESVVRRLLRIQGVHNYTPKDLLRAVTFLSQHHERYPFAGLVADTFPLARVEEAFRHAIETRALRVAVDPTDTG